MADPDPGRIGETYLIGANGERNNITVLRMILKMMGQGEDAFDWVRDRSGPRPPLRHRLHQAAARARLEAHAHRLRVRAEATIEWYTENRAWWEPAKAATEARYKQQGQ